MINVITLSPCALPFRKSSPMGIDDIEDKLEKRKYKNTEQVFRDLTEVFKERNDKTFEITNYQNTQLLLLLLLLLCLSRKDGRIQSFRLFCFSFLISSIRAMNCDVIWFMVLWGQGLVLELYNTKGQNLRRFLHHMDHTRPLHCSHLPRMKNFRDLGLFCFRLRSEQLAVS